MREHLFDAATWLGAIVAVVIVAAAIALLTSGATPAIAQFGLGFLVSSEWDPVALEFGAGALLYGTLVTSVSALAIALPVGLGCTVFLVRIAPGWLSRPTGMLIETLAAIPSIAFGFWAVFNVVPLVRAGLGGPGFSLLSASLVLAIMVLPTLVAVSRDVVAAVPSSLEEGAVGLGANWAQATWILLVAARRGIFGAAVLALARALGETMAVTMVVGNNPDLQWNLLLPGETMASVLASQYQEASKEFQRQSMIYVALVLLLTTVLVNLAARALIGGKERTRG